jgi:hypothetical protein
VLAGSGIFYMSRQNTLTDWNYGADPNDPGRAVSSNLSGAGLPGKPITALVLRGNDCLLFACEDELWMLKGDPAYGGTLDPVSSEVGIIAPNAWCRTPDGSIVFLTQEGLYLMPGSTCGALPQPLSRLFAPEELKNVDAAANTISMAYDGQRGGVLLSITPTAGTAGDHWWISWPDSGQGAPGLWPETYQTGHQPCCMFAFDRGIGYDRNVLLGSYDGYVRTHSDSATTDDSSQLTSYVYYGPWRLGQDNILNPTVEGGYRDGMVGELVGTLEASGYPVAWSLYAGDTAQDAVKELEPIATGMWRPGRNPSTHPRIRAGAVCLKLSAIGQWAPESVVAVITPKGKQR